MKILNKYWWILAFQGLFLLAVGAIAILQAGVVIRDLVEYLALIFVAFGAIMGIAALILRKKARSWAFMFVIALLELAFGLLIIGNTETSTELFIYAIGGWAFFIGLVQAAFGLAGRGSVILNLVNAFISIAFAGLIIWNPFESRDALTYLVAFYSIVLGLMTIYYSFSLRQWSGEHLATHKDMIEGDKEKANLQSPSD